jgi:hypothetical protein
MIEHDAITNKFKHIAINSTGNGFIADDREYFIYQHPKNIKKAMLNFEESKTKVAKSSFPV